jgi:hypothetical protein
LTFKPVDDRVQILTMRFILVLVVLGSKLSPSGYKGVSTCQEILFTYDYYSLPLENVYSFYPSCTNFTASIPTYVVVNAQFAFERPEQISTIFNLSFGPSAWISGVIHIFAIEFYLSKTKDEDERLKTVSLARRKAAGLVDAPGKTDRA